MGGGSEEADGTGRLKRDREEETEQRKVGREEGGEGSRALLSHPKS